MSSRLARQSLELLTASPSKKNDTDTPKKSQKIKLPKTNKGIKKVKHEIRYGRHQKTRLLQEQIEKRENPIGKHFCGFVWRVNIDALDHLDKLNAEALSNEERLKRNVQIMKGALRSSSLEKKIHNEVRWWISRIYFFDIYDAL